MKSAFAIDEKFTERKTQLAFLLASFVLSILTALATNYFANTFTNGEQMIFGSVVFAVFVLFDLLIVASIEAGHQVKEYHAWRIKSTYDSRLLSIRSSLFQIADSSYSDKDLFLSHFEKELEVIANSVSEVAEKRELRVANDHFLSVERVLSSLIGDPDPVYRLTWELDLGEPLFADLNHRRYFEEAHRLVKTKAIREVRILLILSDEKVLAEQRVTALLDFVQSTDGFDCRLVPEEDYKVLCDGNGLSCEFQEIGIFGSRLLFLTEEYGPDNKTVGVFTKEQSRIDRYKSLFDSVWNSQGISTENPSTSQKKLSLHELFKCDKTQIKP